jgi:hypothetical protein
MLPASRISDLQLFLSLSRDCDGHQPLTPGLSPRVTKRWAARSVALYGPRDTYGGVLRDAPLLVTQREEGI